MFPEIVMLLFTDILLKPDTSLLASTVTALFANTVPLVNPPILLISVELDVTPDKILSSSPVATTSVEPNLNVSVVIFPDTDASPATAIDPLAKVNNCESSLCPIVLFPTTTFAVANPPPVITPVVLIVSVPTSIEPNPVVIEPALSAPTVVKLVLPPLAEYAAFAEVVLILESI